MRLIGLLKISFILMIDAMVLSYLIRDERIVVVIVGCLCVYIFLGGYIELFKECAVKMEDLPAYEREKMQAVKSMLVGSVKEKSGFNISSYKFYLTSEEEMNATAYGGRCMSVTKAAFQNADISTLTAVMAHEAAHLFHYDPEVNRTIFATVTMLFCIVSIMSFTTMIVFFLIGLLLSFFFFRSFVGVMTYRWIQRCLKSLFALAQRIIVEIYLISIGMLSKHAEYRADNYSCQLGYGVQLANFLELAAPEPNKKLGLTEVLHRNHPSTYKRLAKIERYINNNKETIEKGEIL